MKRILIASDGSSVAERAVELGLELAAEQGASIVLLQVSPPGRAVARGALDAAAGRAAERGVRCAVEVAAGHAAEEIAARADTFGADLVVVGAHGRGASAGGRLGSVSREVLASARWPVLIVRGDPDT